VREVAISPEGDHFACAPTAIGGPEVLLGDWPSGVVSAAVEAGELSALPPGGKVVLRFAPTDRILAGILDDRYIAGR
jgi:hypothetical protein